MNTQQNSRPPGRKRPNVWVVTKPDGYAVRMAGRRYPTLRGLTQQSAVRIARSIAREFGTELLVQGEHGQIRFRDSHGSEPFPPKG